MPKVLIITGSVQIDQERLASTSASALMIQAMKRAVLGEDFDHPHAASSVEDVVVVTNQELINGFESGKSSLTDAILCPLTLDLPALLPSPMQSIYQKCRDVSATRQLVEQWGYKTGIGTLWLPIVLTAKGPLYAEVIAIREHSEFQSKDVSSSDYIQPVHLADVWRQLLYELGYRLLRTLVASPAVYLMQFGLHGGSICFDRLLPFPDEPAIASLGVQTPNLFVCHWHCLIGQPLYDLVVDSKDYCLAE